MKLSDLQLPKHNRNAELRLIGALIRIGNYTDIRAQEILANIDKDFFYFNDTKEFFEKIKNSFNNNHNFDFLSLEPQIPDDYVGAFIHLYKDEYASLSHIPQDINDLLILKSLRKQLPVLLQTLIDCHQEGLAESCLDILTQGIHDIAGYTNQRITNKVRSYEEIIDEILRGESETNTALDLNMLTFPPIPKNQMITIAGRSGAGKTYFALYLLDKIAKAEPEKQTLFFNLEMMEEKLVYRHAKLHTDLDEPSELETIQKAAFSLLRYDFKVKTEQGICIEDIETIAKIESMKKPISVIVIDYIGLVRTRKKLDAKSKHIEQSEIAQRLAALAGSLKCIVICILQVNRDHKTRSIGDKCPYPTDSAESMGCERSSALWLGIDRPEIDSQELRYKELFVIKNRKSREETGFFTEYMQFRGGRFYEIDQISAQRKLDNFISDVSELTRY